MWKKDKHVKLRKIKCEENNKRGRRDGTDLVGLLINFLNEASELQFHLFVFALQDSKFSFFGFEKF